MPIKHCNVVEKLKTRIYGQAFHGKARTKNKPKPKENK